MQTVDLAAQFIIHQPKEELKIKQQLKEIFIIIPAIILFAFLILLADRSGKLGVLGTLITLLINPNNYELRYGKKIKRALKLKIIYLQDVLLSFFCSCYITYIITHNLSNQLLRIILDLSLPSCFFIIIWLYVRVLVPKVIHHYNNLSE
ncbi:hypothetical protein [Enterococcus sp. LJL120]